MAWTTFAALTQATGAQLDANLTTLSGLVNIPVSISGTNTLALVNNAGAAAIAGYSNGMVLTGVAAATNTGATTAALGALGALNVYVDTISGPAALAGGEIVQNCEITLVYDPALNSGAGGFHLITGAGQFASQTLNPKALEINGSPSILGLPSALYTVSFGSIGPNSFSLATVTISGIHIGDQAILTLGTLQTAGIIVQAEIPATGSVVLTAFNITTNTTVAPATAPYRLSVMRFS